MKIVKLTALIAIVILTSCGSSTKLINSWSDKENTPQTFDKLGVAVLFPDQSNRYVTERAVAKKLQERKINAEPTYDLFPFAGRFGEFTKDKSPESVRKIIVDKITENNFDGFMIITLFDQQREERWVSDRNFRMGGTGYYGSPWGMAGTYSDYYYYSMGTFYDDGHYVDHVTYFLECNLYDVKSQKLIWRGQTKSVNIKSVEEEAQKLAELVGHELIFKKVIEP